MQRIKLSRLAIAVMATTMAFGAFASGTDTTSGPTATETAQDWSILSRKVQKNLDAWSHQQNRIISDQEQLIHATAYAKSVTVDLDAFKLLIAMYGVNDPLLQEIQSACENYDVDKVKELLTKKHKQGDVWSRVSSEELAGLQKLDGETVEANTNSQRVSNLVDPSKNTVTKVADLDVDPIVQEVNPSSGIKSSDPVISWHLLGPVAFTHHFSTSSAPVKVSKTTVTESNSSACTNGIWVPACDTTITVDTRKWQDVNAGLGVARESFDPVTNSVTQYFAGAVTDSFNKVGFYVGASAQHRFYSEGSFTADVGANSMLWYRTISKSTPENPCLDPHQALIVVSLPMFSVAYKNFGVDFMFMPKIKYNQRTINDVNALSAQFSWKFL